VVISKAIKTKKKQLVGQRLSWPLS